MDILSLDSVFSENDCGGKAFHLSTMLRAGYRVPKGFVIPKHVFDTHTSSNLPLDEKFIDELKNALNEIGADSYMVRSSAIGEDSIGNSFAGQLDSFQSSNDIEDILVNILKCWESYSSETVAAYQKTAKKKLKGMAVVIQELVDPDIAGVIFTRNPIEEEELLIEYVEGHGENMVNGNIHPESVTYSRATNNINGSTNYNFTELIATSKSIERFYGYPVDIEWAMKNDVFYMLQSRPITTVGKSEKIQWSNTNVNENYPDAISPLLYSIARESYYHYFKNLSQLFFVSKEKIQQLESAYANVIGVFACKMYYNMSSIYRIISASPFSALLLKSFNNFVGYQDDNELVEKEKVSKWRFVLRVIKHNLSLGKTVAEFENRVDSFKKENKTSISFEELKNRFHGFIEIRMHSWYKASLADFFAMIHHGTLGKFCEKYYGESSATVHNKLIQAIPNLVSSEPVLLMHDILVELKKDEKRYEHFLQTNSNELWEVIKYDKSDNKANQLIHVYLDEWGFRCSGELMLTTQNYNDDPSKFIDLLKQYAQLPDNDPRELIELKSQERKDTIKAFKKLIWKKHFLLFPIAILHVFILKTLVKLAGDGIRYRERVRLKQALLYYEFKKLLKKSSAEFIKRKWIKDKDDILFFKYQELVEMFNSSSMLPGNFQQHVDGTRAEFLKQSELSYPDEFCCSIGGDYKAEESTTTSDDSESCIKGLIACGGKVKGRARVLNSVMEAGKLQKGDILITRQTDPGWIVVFPMISGLVVERGGMLSHGAIVSREFGIPAIVGVENATTRIQDGELIVLNADTGEITKLSEQDK